MVWRFLPLTLILATPAAAQPGAKMFGSWIAGCDNENVCTAIRPAWDAVDVQPTLPGTPFLRVRHLPHRDAIPDIRLIDPKNPAPKAVLKPPLVTLVFRFNDNPGVGNMLIYRAVIDGEGGYRFADEDARSIIYGLRKAKSAAVSIADQRKFSLNPAPFDEALAFFDREQDLADTPGAFVLRPGNVMYDYAHPVPPQADVVQLSAFTARQLDDWRADYPEVLPDETVLVAAEPSRGLVTIRRFRSPDRDCGVVERWGYAGQANGFVLVERREMPVCSGIAETHWIRTHRADTLSPEIRECDS